MENDIVLLFPTSKARTCCFPTIHRVLCMPSHLNSATDIRLCPGLVSQLTPPPLPPLPFLLPATAGSNLPSAPPYGRLLRTAATRRVLQNKSSLVPLPLPSYLVTLDGQDLWERPTEVLQPRLSTSIPVYRCNVMVHTSRPGYHTLHPRFRSLLTSKDSHAAKRHGRER